MKTKVDELKKAREGLVDLINGFPKKKREAILFDKWSLKDILVHLTGWANYQIEALEKLKSGKEQEIVKNLKNSINDEFVKSKKKIDWDKVYQDFLAATDSLAKQYQSLPKQLWGKRFYKNKKTTPKEFIDIEIRHYNNTHGPQIKKFLKLLTPCKPGSRND